MPETDINDRPQAPPPTDPAAVRVRTRDWYSHGPIDPDGGWSPKGGIELLVHSRISEDDDERKNWIPPTDEEEADFVELLAAAPGVPVTSAAFADHVARAIGRNRQ